MHELGVNIILHCFEYGRGKQKKLNQYCKEVYYYDRNSFVKSFLSKDPFIVKSRSNDVLIENLNKDTFPVLFEGLHTTYPLFSNQLKNKKVYVRTHNIEHDFYQGLGKSESNLFKKRFFKQESKKLKKFEKILMKTQGIFTISPFEQNYFSQKYGNHCDYVPAFHNHQIETKLASSEKFVLYHGNVSVSDNARAAHFLIDAYKKSGFRLVIASSFHNASLQKEIDNYTNIQFVEISNEQSLNHLFEKAHIHALPTFQKTGIKLKLLNTLYQGRFILVNNEMVEDTGLESLCSIANSKKAFLEKTHGLMKQEFLKKEREKRFKILEKFNPIQSAQKIIDIIF